MGKIETGKLLVVAALCVVGTDGLMAVAAPAPAAAPVKTKVGTEITKNGSSMVSTTPDAKTPSYNAKALHRLDFKITGKSCAACLLGIQKRISTVPGAIKAAVQLQAPYAAVVLFDASKTNQKALFVKAKETVPEVNFESVEDTAIDKVPIVLVPKIGSEVLTH